MTPDSTAPFELIGSGGGLFFPAVELRLYPAKRQCPTCDRLYEGPRRKTRWCRRGHPARRTRYLKGYAELIP